MSTPVRALVGLAVLAGQLPAAAALAAPAAPAKLGELIMDGPDAGHIFYSDHCSNGANSDDDGRDRFVAALRADPRSRLAQTIARTTAQFVTDPTEYEIVLGDWTDTYYLRMGCGETSISRTAFVFLHDKISNTHELSAKYMVTIDDDVVADRRALRVRDITPLQLRK